MCKTIRVVGGMVDMCAPHHVKDDAVCVDKYRVSGPPTASLQTSDSVPWVATRTRWCALVFHGDMMISASPCCAGAVELCCGGCRVVYG